MKERIEQLEVCIKDTNSMLEKEQKHINWIKEELAKLKNGSKLDDRCPVFLEKPKNGDVYYCIIPSGTENIGKFHWTNNCKTDIENYIAGNCFKFKKACRRYPINPGIYKYLQIIYKYFGGEPSEEDWAKDTEDVTKYYIFYRRLSAEWEWSAAQIDTAKIQGTIYMLKEPDVPKILEELGDLISWLK